jgi:hypothetical protein
MGKRKLTYYFLGILVCVIAFFDVYVIMEGGKESSISHVLIELTYEYPSISFLLGFVCGHIVWRMRSTEQMKKVVGEP